MSLRITNLATAKQLEILQELEYTGTGKYAADKLTKDEASDLIDELFTQKRYSVAQIQRIAPGWYDMPIVDVAGTSPEEYDDPFSAINKENK
jgi:hypothetical protein